MEQRCNRHPKSPLAWGRGSKLGSSLVCYLSPSSPLAWGRGSKPRLSRRLLDAGAVAPRVGAWIETFNGPQLVLERKSPLAWGRGSKRLHPQPLLGPKAVAPRVGAWIETAYTP